MVIKRGIIMNLKNRHFLTLKDYSKEEIRYLLDLAHQLKADKKAGKIGQHLLGKNVCLIFEKTSTRTRCSFEVAALDEGGHATFLSNSQMGKKESIEDTAKVLGRMYDGIEFRGFKQETVEALAKYSGVPVWNGLTDVDHPTQTLADFLTIEEHLDKPLEDIKFVFTGDIRNNVCYGLMYGAVKMGMHFVCLGPKSLHIDPEVLAYCKEEAKKSGGTIEVTDNVDEAVKDADVIYTDIWVSMGEDESLYKPRVEMLSPYKVTQEMMSKTGKDPLQQSFTTRRPSSLTRRCSVRVSPIAENSLLLPPVGVWAVSQSQCGRPPSQAGYASSPWWAVAPPTS